MSLIRAAALALLLVAPGTQAPDLGDQAAAAIAGARLKDAKLGVLIHSTRSGTPVFSRDEKKVLRLASNSKLFPTAAAIALLGPGYRFRTTLALDDATGDLHVLGSGDPNISGRLHGGDPLACFREAASRLKKAGVARLAGDVVAHPGIFDDEPQPPDWRQHSHLEWWACQVSGLTFNDNCVDFEIDAGAVGAPPKVRMIPDTRYVTFVNKAKTVRGRGTWGFSRKDGTNEIVLSGEFPAGADNVKKSVAIHDPARYFATVLRETLVREGVAVDGQVRLAGDLAVPAKAREMILAEHTLAEAAASCNTVSQNLHAELILKLLGFKLKGEGSTARGAEAVQDWLRKDLGISDVVLVNGSGLTRDNKASAGSVAALLAYMHGHRHGKAFVDSLAVAGTEPGTLRDRLENVKGRVRAKTGTIAGVSTLSGYAEAASGETFVFSILVNDWKDGSPKALEDRLATLIAGWKGS